MGYVTLDIEKLVVIKVAGRQNQGCPPVQNVSSFLFALVPKPTNGDGAEEQFPLFTEDIEYGIIHLCYPDLDFGIIRYFDNNRRIVAEYKEDENDEVRQITVPEEHYEKSVTIVSRIMVPDEHYRKSVTIEDILRLPNYARIGELSPQ